ncbi:hypothetical protein [Pseudomonas poae]
MSNQASTLLRRVSILAIDRVFASTLMQAKDFFTSPACATANSRAWA